MWGFEWRPAHQGLNHSCEETGSFNFFTIKAPASVHILETWAARCATDTSSSSGSYVKSNFIFQFSKWDHRGLVSEVSILPNSYKKHFHLVSESPPPIRFLWAFTKSGRRRRRQRRKEKDRKPSWLWQVSFLNTAADSGSPLHRLLADSFS